MTSRDPRGLLRSLFDAAVAAADPSLIVPGHLPEPPKDGRSLLARAKRRRRWRRLSRSIGAGH
jgi:hypothetical protein